MLWKELEDRVYAIIRKFGLTDRDKAELIMIEFNQYPGSGSGGTQKDNQSQIAKVCE